MWDRSEVSVVSPRNDGESKMIVDICQRLNVDIRVSKQPWGASLEVEPPENLQDLRRIVAIVEMPAPDAEQALRTHGHDVIIVDHHFYPRLKLDRRQPISSLEQIASILGYSLNRFEMGVALNDRNYIFGLIQAGYSIEEILEIRRFDLEAQGVTSAEIDAVKDAVEKAQKINGITILRIDGINAGFAQDFLVLRNPNEVQDLLILGGSPIRKVQFYGDPQKVERLADLGEWMGGGDQSKFWGTNHPDVAQILQRLGLDGKDLQ
jgi:hypothetical protein